MTYKINEQSEQTKFEEFSQITIPFIENQSIKESLVKFFEEKTEDIVDGE